MHEFILKIYITGRTPTSERAIANLERLCEAEMQGRYKIVVVDLLEHPQLAEEEQILATPTLVKELPPPMRRIIGDLSDKEKVLFGLDLRPVQRADEKTSAPAGQSRDDATRETGPRDPGS